MHDLTFSYAGALNKKTLQRDFFSYSLLVKRWRLSGRNGAGKTTLGQTAGSALYGADSGQICFEGVDVRDWDTDRATGKKLGLCFNNTGRYEATLADNIAYGSWETLENDIEAIQEIAKRAKLDDLVKKLPHGYDTFLGRMFGEYNLSGGQWQRLAIARAFARDASLA